MCTVNGRMQVVRRTVGPQCRVLAGLTRGSVILCLALLAIGARAVAQVDSTCIYETCALRVKQRFPSAQLVRGSQEEKVVGFGLLAPDLSKIVNPDGSINPHFAAYRGHANRRTLSLTLALAAISAWTFTRNETVGLTLTLSGVGLMGLAIVQTIRAEEDLSRGVWLYNSKLPGCRSEEPER